MYKIVQDIVPALKVHVVFNPIRNKHKITQKSYTDFNVTNFVDKYTSNSECYKVPPAKTDIFKKSYFVTTPSDWNKLTDSVIFQDDHFTENIFPG